MQNPIGLISSWNWFSSQLFAQKNISPATHQLNQQKADVKRLARLLKKQGALNFQLIHEYVPSQRGTGLTFHEHNTSYLALMADQSCIMYNAFKEQSGNWKLDTARSQLHVTFDKSLTDELALQEPGQTLEIESFANQKLVLVWKNHLGRVERTYQLVKD